MEKLKSESESIKSGYETKLNELYTKNSSIAHTKLQVERELSRSKQKNEELRVNLLALEREIEVKQQKIDSTLAELELSQVKIGRLEDKRKQMEAEHQLKVKELDIQLQKSTKNEQDQSREIGFMQMEIEERQQEISQLQSVLGEREATISKMEQEIDVAKREIVLLIKDKGTAVVVAEDEEQLHQRLLANNIRIRELEMENRKYRELMLRNAVIDKLPQKNRLDKTVRLVNDIPADWLDAVRKFEKLDAFQLIHNKEELGPDVDKADTVKAHESTVWHPHLQNFTPLSSRPTTAMTVDPRQPINIQNINVDWNKK